MNGHMSFLKKNKHVLGGIYIRFPDIKKLKIKNFILLLAKETKVYFKLYSTSSADVIHSKGCNLYASNLTTNFSENEKKNRLVLWRLS